MQEVEGHQRQQGFMTDIQERQGEAHQEGVSQLQQGGGQTLPPHQVKQMGKGEKQAGGENGNADSLLQKQIQNQTAVNSLLHKGDQQRQTQQSGPFRGRYFTEAVGQSVDHYQKDIRRQGQIEEQFPPGDGAEAAEAVTGVPFAGEQIQQKQDSKGDEGVRHR
ncbi:hypothetical protein D3C81_1605360 [compost metagenome]